jgi:hypothetical protein
MARLIQGGVSVPAEVVMIGKRIKIWKIDGIYSIFYGDQKLDVTDPEASELAVEIAQWSTEEVEVKWVGIIDALLAG